jgi:hypothetical protein
MQWIGDINLPAVMSLAWLGLLKAGKMQESGADYLKMNVARLSVVQHVIVRV